MVRTTVIFVGLFLSWCSSAFACSCNQTETVSENVDRTPVIFQGTVVELPASYEVWSGTRAQIKFKVTRVYKGEDVADYELVSIPNVNAAGCAMRFRVGNKALVFAHMLDENRGLSTSTCAKGHFFKDADYLNYLENGVGKEDVQRKTSRLSFQYSKYLYPWEQPFTTTMCSKGTNTLSATIENYRFKHAEQVEVAQNLTSEQLLFLSLGYLRDSFARKKRHARKPALTYLKMVADRTDSDAFVTRAQAQLGQALTKCLHGVSRDIDLARTYLEKASANDHSPAIYSLALIHLQERMGHHDPELAQDYVEKCVELGNKSCVRLAEIIEKRKSIDLNSEGEFATFYREKIVPNIP